MNDLELARTLEKLAHSVEPEYPYAAIVLLTLAATIHSERTKELCEHTIKFSYSERDWLVSQSKRN